MALVRSLRKKWVLLRKEKDEASLPICFRQGSFMPSFSFCVSEGFFIALTPRWSL